MPTSRQSLNKLRRSGHLQRMTCLAGGPGLAPKPLPSRAEMGEVIKALKENGLKDKVKVLIGGAAVSEEYAQEIGADAYCVDGFHAIKVLEAYHEAKA